MKKTLNIILWVKVSDLDRVNDVLNGIVDRSSRKYEREEVYSSQPGLLTSNGQRTICITVTYEEFNLLIEYFELV
tara:strand:- start:2003 stop:2227 length:225 start_codon:yes stop_codon:yes gene_type:complete